MAQRIPFYQDPAFWRPQTYALLGALACVVALSAAPLWQLDTRGATGHFTLQGVQWRGEAPTCWVGTAEADATLPHLAFTLLLLFETLVTLALYGRRPVQRLLALAGAVNFGVFAALSYFVCQTVLGGANAPCAPSISPSWGLVGALLGAVLCLVAVRGIQHDIATLKRMDRFR
ncbi:MAG: DUF4293 family protein [Bacteroidia bacterium]|nr:DUF4293 family protein [Bacteroidia bacterium]